MVVISIIVTVVALVLFLVFGCFVTIILTDASKDIKKTKKIQEENIEKLREISGIQEENIEKTREMIEFLKEKKKERE